MAAISRWVKYPVDSIGVAGDGGNGCKGDRGFSIGTDSPGDTITLSATTNKLYVAIGGDSSSITLVSGIDLDPRFIAKDITEKLHAVPEFTGTDWTNAICRWENAYNPRSDVNYGYRFKIYSGDNESTVVVSTGGNDAGPNLGFSNTLNVGGVPNVPDAHTYGFQGTVNVSGTYNGLFDEVYKVVITNDNDAVRGIGTPNKNTPGNTYDGNLTTGGVFNATSDTTYTISISAEGKHTMGAGTGNVPVISWTSSTYSDDSPAGGVELLYPDHWINIGKFGLMVKFSDAVFNTISPAWTIDCFAPDYSYGTTLDGHVGDAQYAWASDRGDKSTSVVTTISGAPTPLGTRGLTIQFIPNSPSDKLRAIDEFYVYCSGPAPEDHGGDGINSLNYGNVTVSTESDVKAVMFEVKSGAVEVSTVRFGLQSHGTFLYHNPPTGQTKFRFGTVGVDKTALGLLDAQNLEWHQGVAANDLSDSTPNYLYKTKDDLSEVQTADDSESIGNYGLVSDAMFVNIRLGSSETGANSSINMRLYFDYS